MQKKTGKKAGETGGLERERQEGRTLPQNTNKPCTVGLLYSWKRQRSVLLRSLTSLVATDLRPLAEAKFHSSPACIGLSATKEEILCINSQGS